MKKTGNKKRQDISKKIILALQLVATVVLMGFLIKLDVLPPMYMALAATLSALMLVIMILAIGGSKSRRIVFKVISVVLTIGMLVGAFVCYKGDSVLNKISGANVETNTISVIVMKDSKAAELKDVKDETFGVTDSLDKDNLDKTLADIRKQIPNVKTKEYKDIDSQVKGLYGGEVKVIVMNEKFRALAEASKEDFTTKTKVIYTFKVTSKVENSGSKVDVTEDTFNVYISGIDTDGDVSTVSRSDVNMIVTVNPQTNQILMTSIPRDYYVTLATSGAKDKLTHSGIYGIKETTATIENLMGIKIDYYVRVNFSSVITIVDALGGITVDNPRAFSADDGSYYYEAGSVEMDGAKALCYVRERHNLLHGDNDRIANQQRVLKGILSKMMSKSTISRYSSVLDAISGSFQTSMSNDDIQELIKMQLSRMPSWEMKTYQLAGTGTYSSNCYAMPGYKLYVVEPDQKTVDKAASLIKSME